MLSLGHDNRRRAVSACYGVAAAVLAFATIGARPLHAQQATATWTELSPRTPETGQPFRLDIHITTVPTSAIRVLAADWPAGIRVLGGPELRDPDSSGDAATTLSYSLEARRSGSYLIEGFLVRLDDEVGSVPFALGKVDVEGAELFVFKGAAKMLKAHNPPVWIVEFGDASARFGYGGEELARFLQKFGYRFARFEPAGNRLEWNDELWRNRSTSSPSTAIEPGRSSVTYAVTTSPMRIRIKYV